MHYLAPLRDHTKGAILKDYIRLLQNLLKLTSRDGLCKELIYAEVLLEVFALLVA